MKTVCIALLLAVSLLASGCANSSSDYFGISRGDVITPKQWVGLYGITLAVSAIVVTAHETEGLREPVRVAGYAGTYGIPDAALALVSGGLSILPPGDTVTADYTPVPHDGSFGASFGSRLRSGLRNWEHSLYTYKYYFMGANSDQPPYERWMPDTWRRDKTTIHRTIDHWLLHYDWDDPYVN